MRVSARILDVCSNRLLNWQGARAPLADPRRTHDSVRKSKWPWNQLSADSD
jgi:hypothetical protein